MIDYRDISHTAKNDKKICLLAILMLAITKLLLNYASFECCDVITWCFIIWFVSLFWERHVSS